jgi:hybrid polyketide synthase/nonribosomal peptide synthetase ACE1
MAVEAMAVLADKKPIGLINLENFVIGYAMTIPEGLVGLECLIKLQIVRSSDEELCCEFTCSSGLPWDASSSMLLNAKATITIAFHEPSPDTLLSLQSEEDLNLADREVDVERFYSQLTRLGYNYSGTFRAVTSIRRQKDFATGTLQDQSEDNWEDQLILHPCWLDTALQTSLVAYSYPHDERLWTLHVPTSVPSIRINPYFTRLGGGSKQRILGFQSFAHEPRDGQMSCDVDILAGEDMSHTFVQMESFEMKPFSPATPDSDALLFSKFDYKLAVPAGEAVVSSDDELSSDDAAVLLGTERMGFFYARRLLQEITPEERANTLPHFQHLLNWAEHVVSVVSGGKHPNVPQEVVHDTHETIQTIIRKWPQASDIRLLEAVGENIVEQVRQNGNILESMMKDDVLNRFYHDSKGLEKANIWAGRLVAQIVHRYPHLRILEIGAGTGGATHSILSALNGAFSSYTFTDISAGFFERAQERFKKWEERMIFKTYDMEKSPAEQGFLEGSYDIVLASNALHATGKLDEMMVNARWLLKPGGYLIPLEIISNDFLGIGTTMGGLPGWWAGAAHDERRRMGPLLTLQQWDTLTRAHGFGGVETATPGVHKLLPYSVFACQAVDERLNALRAPLSQASADLTPSPSSTTNLIIIQGSTSESRKVAGQVSQLLEHAQTQRYSKITRLTTLEELTELNLPISSSVLCLTDLNEPFLQVRSPSKLNNLKTLWRRSGSILWVSRGIRDYNPYASMVLGLSRAMRSEYPNINVQMLDLDVVDGRTPQMLAEALIRLEILGMYRDTNATGDEFLWSLEPELVYENDQLLIPRMYPSKEANNRYNTYRRTIHQTVELGKQIVAMKPKGESFELSSVSPLRLQMFDAFSEGRKTVQVSHSLLQMVKVHNAGYFMLCVGTDTATGQNLIALSDQAETPAPTLAEWTIPVSSPPIEAINIIPIAALILAKSIIAVALPAGRVLIHEVDAVLGNAIKKEAEKSNVKVWFSSSVKGNKMKNCFFVNSKLPKRLISRLLPRNVSLFINLAQAPGADGVGQLIAKCISPHTPCMRSSDFLKNEPLVFAGASTKCIREAIETAWKASQEQSSSVENETSVVPLKEVGSHSIIGEPLSAVDWNVTSVEVSLTAIDTGNIFRADGTYLLVGLSGELGQSLCQWMVAHGARNVVLTSRKPKVRPAFIKMIEGFGAIAKFMPL